MADTSSENETVLINKEEQGSTKKSQPTSLYNTKTIWTSPKSKLLLTINKEPNIMMKLILRGQKDIPRKRENVGYEHFLFIQQFFETPSFSGSLTLYQMTEFQTGQN